MPGLRTKGADRMLAVIAAVLREKGAQGWLVGGSVRDRELDRFSPDIDVVVTGDAGSVAQDAAERLRVPWFTLSEEHRAYRVVGEVAHLDVAAVRGDDILTDLGERDFTINAVAQPIGAQGVLGAAVDPFGGLRDLRARRLAAVSGRIFEDDPLRLMRAARFAHVLRLDIDPELRNAVRACAGLIRAAAAERIAGEMVLTFDAARSGDAARLWRGLGLLEAVAPEIEPGDAHGLFIQLDRLEEILHAPAGVFPQSGDALECRLARAVDGAVRRPTALRLAALFRQAGPVRAAAAGRRLKLSNPLMSLIQTAARVAACGAPPAPATPTHAPGREAVLYLWAAAPWEAEVILLDSALSLRDRTARGDGGAGGLKAAQALMALWARRESCEAAPLPVGGQALMTELQLEPGPLVGKALRAARLAWEAGEVTTTEEAVAAARASLEKG